MKAAQRRGVALAGLAEGLSAREVARRVGVSPGSVWRWAKLDGVMLKQGRLGGTVASHESRKVKRPPRPAPEGDYVDGNGRLTMAARMLIRLRIDEGLSDRLIAEELGVSRQTVWRERKRGSIDQTYRWRPAQQRADEARRRPKQGKLLAGTPLWAEVVARLNRHDSPEQIAGRLKLDYPGREDMQVSHETIYQALYVTGQGSLRHELTVHKARLRRAKRVSDGVCKGVRLLTRKQNDDRDGQTGP